jgi:hypothetical protein
VIDENLGHVLPAFVILGIQSEFPKVLVFPDQLLWGTFELVEKSLELGLRERRFEVLNDLEPGVLGFQ